MIQQEGLGWRLSRDPSRSVFPVLIGGQDWALELKESEACELASLIADLTESGIHELLACSLPESIIRISPSAVKV